MKKEVVHVKTQEQYDYVTEKLNYNWNENNWLDERENTCLIIDEKVYGNLWYYNMYERYKILTFNEFKLRYEPQLKIGDTFEKDGFVCRVESEVEKWVYDKYQEAYYKTKEWYSNYIVITNKEFIAQLEKYSK